MTLTIDLEPEVERRLTEKAQANGVSLADYARTGLSRESDAPAAPTDSTGEPAQAQSLYELFARVRGLLTDEEIGTYLSRTPSTSRPVDFVNDRAFGGHQRRF